MSQNASDITITEVQKPDNHVSPEEELPYGDCKRSNEFTSEKYKLEISNLPRNFSYHVAKQMLSRHYKLNPHKIRLGRGIVYLAFGSQGERDEAISKVDNTYWKGRMLNAKIATARYDPCVKQSKPNTDTAEIDNPEEDDQEVEDLDINSQVCPMYKRDYDEQIRIKARLMKSLMDFSKQIRKLSPSLKKDAPELHNWCLKNDANPFPFDGVERSPVIKGYRNKCEFNVGGDGTVGFRLGRYKNGTYKVVKPPEDCPVVNEKMHQVLSDFQSFLNDKTNTRLRGFNQLTHEGHVSQLTVRTTQQGECLAIVHLYRQNLSDEELDEESKSIVDVLSPHVQSLYLSFVEKNHSSGSEDALRLVKGSPQITEKLSIITGLDLSFRIGPMSFFQVNTKGAEVLYRTIIEIAELNSKSLVLDVGCGTGTIGLSIARQVKYVIGIELVKSAIEDAKSNAKQNNIENVTHVCGKAEDLINESIMILKNMFASGGDGNEADIVAIVDPPRIGFNTCFVKSLRASKISKVIYIACDAKANSNLISLCRPTSKAYQGQPFIPVRAKAVDLFPHTKCCELILVYERLKPTEDLKEEKPDANMSC